MTPEEIALFIDALHRVGANNRTATAVAADCLKEHPTRHQSMMRFCVAFVIATANVQNFDPRNEASVLLARKIIQNTTARDRALPMI